jgi:hypothetical protein
MPLVEGDAPEVFAAVALDKDDLAVGESTLARVSVQVDPIPALMVTGRLSGTVTFDTGGEALVEGVVTFQPAPMVPAVESVTLKSDRPEIKVTPTDDPLVFTVKNEG